MDEKDIDYNPIVDTFVNEVDDEETIEEEENFSDDSDNSQEIERLKEESEIPLDELLMMYKLDKKKETSTSSGDNESSNKIEENKTLNVETDGEDEDDDSEEEEEEEEENNKNNKFRFKKNKDLINLINSNNSYSEEDDDDDEDDFDFDPNSLYVAKIKIGPEYQIDVENSCCEWNSNDDHDKDELMWDPCKLDDNDVTNYLKILQNNDNLLNVKEDERAFNILKECNYNINEAVTKYNQQEEKQSWSEEDNLAFEEGYKEYGKDFKKIQENMCQKNTIGELVNYYYLWKKTDRHDYFVNKFKIKTKNNLLHSSATDYMEKFMLEREQLLTTKDSLKQEQEKVNESIQLEANNEILKV